MRPGSEYYRAETYQVFLRNLDAIERSLIAMSISFDPTLPITSIETDRGLSENTKYAWYLYQIIDLLKRTVKGSVHESKSWFPQLSFYARVQAALPTLDAYFKEIRQIEAENPANADHFLLGVLFFELLQALNPRSTHGNNELWSLLYHGSPAWREGSRRMPVILDENLHAYFNTVSSEEKICLLDKIQDLAYHAYLQADVTPANSRNALESLCASATSQIAVVPVDISSLSGNLDSEHQKCMEQLVFLQKQLIAPTPIEATVLASALQTSTVDILDSFDCAVLLKEDRCFYLRPTDKLKFVFDAIVFRPTESDYSELSVLAFNLGTYFAPRLTNYIIKESPGTIYIRSKLASYEPIEYNENLYSQLSVAQIKKEYYQADGAYILKTLMQRLGQELQLKKDLLALAARIDSYQQERAFFAQKILSLIGLLQTRITNIESFRYSPEVITQFEALYLQQFGAATLESQAQQLGVQLSTIKAVETVDLKEGSQLADTFVKINGRVQWLHEQDSTTTMVHQFTELVKVIQRYEIQTQQEQARFTFPAEGPNLRSDFPYWSLLCLVLATMGIAISIGILAGNAYFTCLVLPMLAAHTVAICTAALAVGSVLALKSGVDLMRYRLFTLSRTEQLETERPDLLQHVTIPH